MAATPRSATVPAMTHARHDLRFVLRSTAINAAIALPLLYLIAAARQRRHAG
jgi:hypothetical protein